jgi:hypothetical protein
MSENNTATTHDETVNTEGAATGGTTADDTAADGSTSNPVPSQKEANQMINTETNESQSTEETKKDESDGWFGCCGGAKPKDKNDSSGKGIKPEPTI